MTWSVVLFGDSLLGQFTKRQLDALEHALRDTVVVNCAAGGSDSADGVRRAALVARMSADVVVLSFGMNDCAPGRRIEPAAFADNVRTMVTSFEGSRLVAFLPPSIIEREGGRGRARRNSELAHYRDILRGAVPDGSSLDTDDALRRAGIEPAEAHRPDGIHLLDVAYAPLVTDLARLVSRR